MHSRAAFWLAEALLPLHGAKRKLHRAWALSFQYPWQPLETLDVRNLEPLTAQTGLL